MMKVLLECSMLGKLDTLNAYVSAPAALALDKKALLQREPSADHVIDLGRNARKLLRQIIALNFDGSFRAFLQNALQVLFDNIRDITHGLFILHCLKR
jgi:hypothetical protein